MYKRKGVDLEERRRRREAKEVYIWPPSSECLPSKRKVGEKPAKRAKKHPEKVREPLFAEPLSLEPAPVQRVEEPDFGPSLPSTFDMVDTSKITNYGNDAIAAYVQSDVRIPRRGEVGYLPDEIATFEASGFVMSGSRNQEMNIMRLKKENQVISQEESKALLNLKRQASRKKEEDIVSSFKELVSQKIASIKPSTSSSSSK